MAEPDGWLRDTGDGAILRVHARPGASTPGIAGFHGDAVCVRVRARAVEGAANRELLSTLASALGLPRTALAIESGAHGRAKRVRVDGLDGTAIRARLAPVLFVDKPGPHD